MSTQSVEVAEGEGNEPFHIKTDKQNNAYLTIGQILSEVKKGNIVVYKNNRGLHGWNPKATNSVRDSLHLEGLGSLALRILKNGKYEFLDWHSRLKGLQQREELGQLSEQEKQHLVPVKIAVVNPERTYEVIAISKSHSTSDGITNKDTVIGKVMFDIIESATLPNFWDGDKEKFTKKFACQFSNIIMFVSDYNKDNTELFTYRNSFSKRQKVHKFAGLTKDETFNLVINETDKKEIVQAINFYSKIINILETTGVKTCKGRTVLSKDCRSIISRSPFFAFIVISFLAPDRPSWLRNCNAEKIAEKINSYMGKMATLCQRLTNGDHDTIDNTVESIIELLNKNNRNK